MNIFILNPSPSISASYHCDQHIHKMILESAQMLSSACHTRGFSELFPYIYKPAYLGHPCTKWVAKSPDNMLWVCELAEALEFERQSSQHSATPIIKLIKDFIHETYPISTHLTPTPHVFAGPAFISLNNALSITEKYQWYYRFKHKSWVDKGRAMTYKNRLVPEFMSELIF